MSWIAIGRADGAVIGYVLRDGAVVGHVRGASEAEVLTALDTDRVEMIRIGDGTPDAAPCALLPAAKARLPVITQEQPSDILGAWVRLWIAGFLELNDGWDGVICTTEGDVTHWVHVSAHEVVSFASFLTPRLMHTLAGSSVLDLSALADTQSRPEKLAAHLRQAEVCGSRDATTGHLIGAELAAARVYWLGQQVALIMPERGGAYMQALEAQGIAAQERTPDDVLAAGLAALGHAAGLE